MSEITTLYETNQKLQKQTERLILLNELGAELNQATSLEEILNIASAKAYAILEADWASIGLLDESGASYAVYALHGLEGAAPVGTQLPVATTQAGQTMQEKRLIVAPDIRHSELADLRQLADQGIRSTMSAPLLSRGRVFGSLNIGREQVDAFDERDETILSQIAAFLASAIDNQQVKTALQESQALYQSSIDGLPQNVYRIDREGHIIFGNSAYLDTLGMTLEACLGKTAYDFFQKSWPINIRRMIGG